MNRRWAIQEMISGAGLLCLPGWFSRLEAQDPDFTLRSDSRLVVLDVSVRDRRGRLVTGLSKGNFVVQENSVVQPVTVFAKNDAPVTFGILVDESRSMTPKRADVLSAAQILVEECNRQDEIFVLHFNDFVSLGLPKDVPFSDSPEQLHLALRRKQPDGKTALYDAVIAGLKHLKLGRREKKALVVVSDGGDTASRHTRKEMLDAVERSIATIYAVGLFEKDDPDKDPNILKQMARMSGGTAYLPSTTEQIIPLSRQIAHEIRTRYTVGYVPQPGRGAVRHIKVQVNSPGRTNLIAHTRAVYRYEAPDESKKPS
jgi:Ca-activated chloride channel family protein